MIALGLSIGSLARQALRTAELLRAEVFRAIEGDQHATVEPLEGLEAAAPAQHVEDPIEGRLQKGGQVGNETRAGEPIRAIYIHGAGTADALTTRAAKSQRRIDLVLDPEEGIEDHRPAIIEIHYECLDARILAGTRVVAVDLERLDAGRAGRRRPRLASHDARSRRHTEIPRYREPLEQRSARNLIRGFDDHGSPPLCAGVMRPPSSKQGDFHRRDHSLNSDAPRDRCR